MDAESRYEHIRRRPGMYIGSTGPSGLQALAMEVVANSLDEVIAGHADLLSVILHEDGSITVRDNGRGLGSAAGTMIDSFVEEVFTSIHTTPTADGHLPHVHLSFGWGLAIVSALSERVELDVQTGDLRLTQQFARGAPSAPAQVVRTDQGAPAPKTGTSLRFWPDPEIFDVVAWDVAPLQLEIERLALLVPGLTMELTVEKRRFGPVDDLLPLFDLRGFSWRLGSDKAPMLISSVRGLDSVRLAIGWTDDRRSSTREIDSSCNLRPTTEGGHHVAGIGTGLRRVFGVSSVEPLMPEMVAVLAVMLQEATFGGPTRGRLDSPEAIELVADAIVEQLPPLLDADPELAATLRRRLGLDPDPAS